MRDTTPIMLADLLIDEMSRVLGTDVECCELDIDNGTMTVHVPIDGWGTATYRIDNALATLDTLMTTTVPLDGPDSADVCQILEREALVRYVD